MARKIGTIITYLSRLRKEKQKIADTLAKFEKKEMALKDELLEVMQKMKKKDKAADLTVKGADLSISLGTQIIANVISWPKFYAHVKKTGDFDLLQKRISNAAFKERLAAKEKVPGLKKFEKDVLNIRSI